MLIRQQSQTLSNGRTGSPGLVYESMDIIREMAGGLDERRFLCICEKEGFMRLRVGLTVSEHECRRPDNV